MTDWRPIDSAPLDGSEVHVKRVHRGRLVAEGKAVWNTPVAAAPMLEPIGPDPLNRPVDYGRELREIEAAEVTPRWMKSDRMHAFPSPTHWRP
ncbi:hypothetical protein DFR49_3395 [Hephaestia caeni]|uniref:Uncharacterized protein n=2 Tax=Hephaestia caeni TaxID=645617 RepID=A0A397NJ28_9SPHN|nr:hypothetical protein DFR49_3395 [Hephaestia caeni]